MAAWAFAGAVLTGLLSLILRVPWLPPRVGYGKLQKFSDATNRTLPTASYERERGIVMVGGRNHHGSNFSYTHEALLSLASLRHRGCTLPMELWHDGDPELIATRSKFEAQDVLVRDFRDLPGGDNVSGFQLAARAVLHSSFREVLFSDADVHALRDPTYLFASPMYTSTGWLMWRDWATKLNFRVTWLPRDSWLERATDLFITDSGLILVDRARHWRALQLVDHMSMMATGNQWHDFSYGDNELWQVAALFHEEAISKAGHRVPIVGYISTADSVTFCGYASIFVDPEHPDDIGRAPMLHRREIKLTMDTVSAGQGRFLKGSLDEPPEPPLTRNNVACPCRSEGCWDYPSLETDGSPGAVQLLAKLAGIEEELLDLSSRMVATSGNGSKFFRPGWYDVWARDVQQRSA